MTFRSGIVFVALAGTIPLLKKSHKLCPVKRKDLGLLTRICGRIPFRVASQAHDTTPLRGSGTHITHSNAKCGSTITFHP